MLTAPFSEIVEGRMWASQRPVWFSGVRLRARTTLVRLDDGGLLVHSPAPVQGEQLQEIKALGEVRWLVVPNAFHHLGTPPAAAAFPNAKVLGPKSAAGKNSALRIDVDIHAPTFAAEVPEFALIALEGVPFLDETLLYHRPTQTLLGADVVLRADASDHWTWRLAARIMGCFERVRVPPDVKKKIVDKQAVSRSLQSLRSLHVERLIVAHAELMEEAPLEQLLAAWRLEGVE